MKLVAGNSNIPLAKSISKILDIPLTKTTVNTFADGEVFCEIEDPLRGEDVFILQSTCLPANDHIMEVLIILDALRRASAKTLTVVMPYFGYGRQDRKSAPRTPITAKLIANLLTTAGAHRITTMDLHAAQIQGFFDIPVDNFFAAPVFAQHIVKNFQGMPLMVVSPDVGGVTRSRSLAKRLNCDLAIIDKRRPRAGVSEVVNIIGNVEGQNCILMDDIVDTAGTLCNGAKALIEAGAKSVHAYITHGVLSGDAIHRIENSAIEKMIVTNSITETEAVRQSKKMGVIDIAPILAEAIKRIDANHSVSSLF